MNCPRCEDDVLMTVTHAYAVGDSSVQSRRCPRCQCVATTQTITQLVNVDPPYGQGAASLARKMKERPGAA